MDRIEARKRWSVSLSAAVLPESNPVKRTDREVVRIGGIPFRLNDDAREASGTGVLVTTGAQFSPVIGDDLRGVLAGSAAAKLYRQSEWNDTSIQGDVGIARLFDRGSLSGGIRLGRQWLGAKQHSTEAGPWARARLRVSPALRLDVALDAARRRHPDRPDLDGWTVSLRPGLDYGFSSKHDAADRDRPRTDQRPRGSPWQPSRRRRRCRFACLPWRSLRYRPGFLFTAAAIPAGTRCFSKSRSDRQMRISVNLLHRALQFRGFAPYVGLVFEWNRSNIPINDYRNRGGVIGISRTF